MPPGGATWPASRRRRPVDPDLDDLPAFVARDVLDHREGGEVRSNARQPALARAPAAFLLGGVIGHATDPYLAKPAMRAKRTAGPPAALDAGAACIASVTTASSPSAARWSGTWRSSWRASSSARARTGSASRTPRTAATTT